MSRPGIDYTTEPAEDLEFVAAHSSSCAPGESSGLGRELIVVDTIHDGDRIPEQILNSPGVRPLVRDGTLWTHYVRERDWGANLVAQYLAEALGLAGYYRVTLARVLMDYNRFPGCSQPGASPQDRLALIEPLASCLSQQEKRQLLATHYDTVSDAMELAVQNKLIKVAIHTYDVHNESLTERPEVSIVTRSLSYQNNSRLPFGRFDPLFPDRLVESCADRVLRDRLALTLERAGVHVEHNYPYALPDGSLEVRYQPWMFFQHIRRELERQQPDSRDDPAFAMVWEMLLNTNLRRTDAEALMGFLHRFRKPPAGRAPEFEAAEIAYEQIRDFILGAPDRVDDYLRSSNRPSALGIEVRKDLVWNFKDGEPTGPRETEARWIAEQIAEGITTYLAHDYPAKKRRRPGGLARG